MRSARTARRARLLEANAVSLISDALKEAQRGHAARHAQQTPPLAGGFLSYGPKSKPRTNARAYVVLGVAAIVLAGAGDLMLARRSASLKAVRPTTQRSVPAPAPTAALVPEKNA